MGEKSHHTSSLREFFCACLVCLGMCCMFLCVGSHLLKMTAAKWEAACQGSVFKDTAGNCLAAAAGMTLISVLLGAYHGARGIWSVLRAISYLPTCCSGSWAVFRHKLRTKPFLWPLALSFSVVLIAGGVSSDLLIRATMNELQKVSPQICAENPPSVTEGILLGGSLGMVTSLASASLFVFTDINKRRKEKAKQYFASSFYNGDADKFDDEQPEVAMGGGSRTATVVSTGKTESRASAMTPEKREAAEV